MKEAVENGAHISAMVPDAIKQLNEEVTTKELKGQCRVVRWDSICDNPPKELKISPIAMILHKSRAYREILDLSFSLRLQDGNNIPSVNEATEKNCATGGD